MLSGFKIANNKLLLLLLLKNFCHNLIHGEILYCLLFNYQNDINVPILSLKTGRYITI